MTSIEANDKYFTHYKLYVAKDDCYDATTDTFIQFTEKEFEDKFPNFRDVEQDNDLADCPTADEGLDDTSLDSKVKLHAQKTLDFLKAPSSKGKQSVGSKRPASGDIGGGIMEGGGVKRFSK